MNQKTTAASRLTLQKKKRVKGLGFLWLTAILTFATPVTPTSAPSLEPLKAYAEEVDYRQYAKAQAQEQYGWNSYQFACLDFIWEKESHWNPKADNPNSSAYGIAQMLGEDSKDGTVQISNGLRYIEHRYGNPCNAKRFWQRNYWY